MFFSIVAAFIKIDRWSPDIPVYGDIDGGFPLVVYDSVMENAVVLAPGEEFMAANQATFTDDKTGEKTLAFGPLSSITEVSGRIYWYVRINQCFFRNIDYNCNINLIYCAAFI